LKKIASGRAERWLDDFIEAADIRIDRSLGIRQAQHARLSQVWQGTGHGAALNYGDCFAYGLAKTMNAPLLCKETTSL